MILLYAYLAAVIIDVAVMWHKLKKKLIDFPARPPWLGGARACILCLEPRHPDSPRWRSPATLQQARPLARSDRSSRRITPQFQRPSPVTLGALFAYHESRIPQLVQHHASSSAHQATR